MDDKNCRSFQDWVHSQEGLAMSNAFAAQDLGFIEVLSDVKPEIASIEQVDDGKSDEEKK